MLALLNPKSEGMRVLSQQNTGEGGSGSILVLQKLLVPFSEFGFLPPCSKSGVDLFFLRYPLDLVMLWNTDSFS